jgi:tricorn protease-like protein
MEYKECYGKYIASCTFKEFKDEWLPTDGSNIPFKLWLYEPAGDIWLFQPRKEVVYQITITNAQRYKKELKAVVAKGLRQMRADLKGE